MSIILHLLVKQIADVYVSTRIVFTLTELYSVVLRWLSQVYALSIVLASLEDRASLRRAQQVLVLVVCDYKDKCQYFDCMNTYDNNPLYYGLRYNAQPYNNLPLRTAMIDLMPIMSRRTATTTGLARRKAAKCIRR